MTLVRMCSQLNLRIYRKCPQLYCMSLRLGVDSGVQFEEIIQSAMDTLAIHGNSHGLQLLVVPFPLVETQITLKALYLAELITCR